MCFCKVRHLDRFIFRESYLLSQNLCESVDEERLSGSLFVNILNDFGREGLADFICILCKELTDLLKGEIRQGDLVLDIEGAR